MKFRPVRPHWRHCRRSVRHRLLICCRLNVFSYLTLNNIVTLEFGLQVTQDHSNWYHSKAWVRFPIRLPYGNVCIPQVSRQSHYETRIRHLVNEIRNKDAEIERLSAAALHATSADRASTESTAMF